MQDFDGDEWLAVLPLIDVGVGVSPVRRLERKGRLIILRKRVAGLNEAALARFVVRASRAARLRGTVNVLVTSSRALRRLNHRFRRKNQATDVLSFPAMPGLETGFAGDVAISADIAAQNARRMGHAVVEEIKILIVHGVLHLAGYDHEHDDGEMARQEVRLRAKLGLPVGLIERTGQPAKDHTKLLTAKSAETPRSTQRRTNKKTSEPPVHSGALTIQTSK